MKGRTDHFTSIIPYEHPMAENKREYLWVCVRVGVGGVMTTGFFEKVIVFREVLKGERELPGNLKKETLPGREQHVQRYGGKEDLA